MDVTGVGIVGLSATGGWAARAHVPALEAIDGLQLRALTASSPESAEAAGREFGVAACADVRELAARDDVDLVVVAVKVPHHLELVTPVLEAGKMAFSEWPLGNGLAEARQMAALARAQGVRTFTGLQARSSPVVRYLRDLVADGYVGEVLSTTLVLSGRSWGGLVASGNRYTLDPANGATLLTISFGHQVDGIVSVLGEFEELSATMASRRTQAKIRETGETVPMSSPDQIGIVGRLEGGAVAAMHVRGGSSRGLNFHWEINGTDGDLVVQTPTGLLQFATVLGGRGDETGLTELPVPAEYHLVPALAGQEDGVAYAVAHAYRQLREDLENGTSVVPDFDAAVRRHQLMEMIEASAATGARFTS
jgi:predicted dehydrogenase